MHSNRHKFPLLAIGVSIQLISVSMSSLKQYRLQALPTSCGEAYLRVGETVSCMAFMVVKVSARNLIKGVNVVLEIAVPEVEGVST